MATDTDNLAIRAKPRSVKRFNRKTLMASAGIVILLVGGVAAYAFRAPNLAASNSSSELYNTAKKPMPDAFETLPASYEDVASPLGPPLPGDLGAAMIGNETVPAPRDNPFQYTPASQIAGSPATTSPPADTTAIDARASDLFFIKPPRRDSAAIQPVQNIADSNPFDGLAALIPPNDAFSGDGADRDPGRQARKEEFVQAETDPNIYNAYRLQAPTSDYQVMAGTIIPATLITGLNSDLPGQAIAQVTENVYDTPTGQYLLIPQGARLLGRYDSIIAFGQSRALMVWNRIIMPDGTSITIDNLPGVDLAGYAGVEDRVDNHTWQLFQAAILSSILSVGAELGRDSEDNEILNALRDGGQRTLNQAGQRIVDRQLNIQPTINVRPGWRLRVIVNKDLILQPYGA